MTDGDYVVKVILQQVIEAQKMAGFQATSALIKYIPSLTSASLEYYQFHSIQQAKAHEEQKEQEEKLTTHIEYFGDSAPIKKEDIEKRIHEFVGLIAKSMQTMMQIAETQSRLWKGKRNLLPHSVWTVLIEEYGKLWQQLSGPVREVCLHIPRGCCLKTLKLI